MEKVISLFGMPVRAVEVEPSREDVSRADGDDARAQHSLDSGGGEARTRFDRDSRGRVNRVSYPDGTERTIRYDRRDNVVEQCCPSGRVLYYSYDDEDRLTRVTDGLGTTREFGYGRSACVVRNGDVTTRFEFRGPNRRIWQRQSIGECAGTVEAQFDERRRPVRLRPPGSQQSLVLEYDEAEKSTRLSSSGGRLYAVVSCDGIQFGNGVYERRRVDPLAGVEGIRVRAPDGSTMLDLPMEGDATGRLRSIGETRLGYDRLDRLQSASSSTGERWWHFDDRGNRCGFRFSGSYESRGDSRGTTDVAVPSGTRCVTDECDRVRRVDREDGHTVAYEYDRDGNRVRRLEVTGSSQAHDESAPNVDETQYRYDGEDRLVEIRRGDRIVRYDYDGLGRRVRRRDAESVTIFHHDLDGRLLVECDAHGEVLWTWLWVGFQCVGRIRGPVGEGEPQFFHTDHRGSVLAVTDAAAVVVQRHQFDLFGEARGFSFAGKLLDRGTGLYHFGARDYDPETATFLTPDTYTFAPDDWRLLFASERDFWGERKSSSGARRRWDAEAADHPQLLNRYAFCLGDPVNNIDLDGHSAWWFFLTIPSSITWALPNTVIALIITIGNILMEGIGWIVWFHYCVFAADFSRRHYPWGNINPRNPYDPDEREHIWFNFDAEPRIGVPWSLVTGSFFVWRAYTLGNVVFISDAADNANAADANSRFVVPCDPDVQLDWQQSLRDHEMRHTFQYAYLGPLFHCLPIPPLVRLISGAAEGTDLAERDRWWEHIDLGGVTWSVGGLMWLLSGGHVKPADVAKWVNPSTWWSTLLPFDWVKIISQGWNLDNWLPAVGVYEFDSVWFTQQADSYFERDSGANSGDCYQTVLEVEEDELFVGQFTRVIAADSIAGPDPAGVTPIVITFGVTPAVDLGGGTNLDPSTVPYAIDLDSGNTAPVQVVNGGGFYFHALTPGTYTISAAGSRTNVTETCEVEVKAVEFTASATSVMVCGTITVEVTDCDEEASYSLRMGTQNDSSATVSGFTYTAGAAAGSDQIEIVVTYASDIEAFATYGDNGLGSTEFVVGTVDVTVSEPVITPDSDTVALGGSVVFDWDAAPQSASTTSSVAGSRFNLATREFIAGPGPIAADVVETVTLDYGCVQYTFDITVQS